MCQGGELHLQCGCGRFDSGPLHRTRSGVMRLTSASVAKWQGTRLQSADRGFDSRPMLGARWLGRWIGLGSSKPDGRVRFPDELRLDIAAVLASVRGRDPSFRSSVRWFESSRRYRARVVQWPRTARFQCAGAGSIPAASTGSWKARSAWCRHRSRKPGGAQASGFDSCTFRKSDDADREDDLAVARAPFAKRMDLLVAVRLRRLPL